MLIMLTTGYCNFFWGGFRHAGYQQALQCLGLESVCIWVTLGLIPASGDACKKGLFCTHRAVCLKNKKKLTIC